MKIFLTKQRIEDIPVNSIIATFFSDERPLKGETGIIDWHMNSYISRQLEQKNISGNLNEKTLILGSSKIKYKKIYLLGMGETNLFDEKKIETIIKQIQKTVSGMQIDSFIFILSRNLKDRKTYNKFLKIFFTNFTISLKNSVNSIYFTYEKDDEKEALLPLKNEYVKLFEEKALNT